MCDIVPHEQLNQTLLKPQPLPYAKKNQESLIAQRKILDAILSTDQLKKNRSEILTKKYLSGFLSLFGVDEDKLLIIGDNEINCEIFRFLVEGCHGIVHEKGEVIKMQEGFITILATGIIKKINDSTGYDFQTQRCLNILSNNHNIQQGLSVLSKRARPNARNSSRPPKNSIHHRVDVISSKTSAKFGKQRTIFSDSQHDPRILSMGIGEGREFECLTRVQVVKIGVLAISKLEGFLECAEKEIIGKFACNVLGMKEPIKGNKLAIKVEKNIFLKNEQISFKPSIIQMLFSGNMMLTINSSFSLQLKENSILNPMSFDKESEKIELSAVCLSDCLVLSLEVSHILKIYEVYPQCIEEIQNYMKNVMKKRKDLFFRIQRKKDRVQETEVWDLDRSQFNNLVGLERQSKNRFRVSREDKKILQDWQDSKHLTTYPYIKLIESYNKVDKIMRNFRQTNTIDCKPKDNSIESSPLNRSVVLQGKDPKLKKRQYYNEKVRRMKIKNIAQKLIPNAGKKNFENDEVEKKIFDNSLFATTFDYPSTSKLSKKNDETKRNVYCEVIERKQQKSLKNSEYNSIFDDDKLILNIGVKKMQERSMNGSFIDVHSCRKKEIKGIQRKERNTTTATFINKEKAKNSKKIGMIKSKGQKQTVIKKVQEKERRIKTAGNDDK